VAKTELQKMKIALIQLNYTVGNIEGNVAKIKSGIKQAKAKGADLAVFAELAICGYPPKDLLLQNGFVEKCEKAAKAIAKECKGIAAIAGGPSRNHTKRGRKVFNSAFLNHSGHFTMYLMSTGILSPAPIINSFRLKEPS
jgi:NAD+ synthase (glutamine-hydrolysing)